MSVSDDSVDFLWETEAGVPQAKELPRARPVVPGLPAETGLWIFVLGDMTIFGAFFLVFLWENDKAAVLFADSAGALYQSIGVLNTLVLLLSSYLVVLALHAHRAGRFALTRRLLAGAGGCALAFAGLKAIEYSLELGDGHTPATDLFFTFYFILTGIHMLHVVIGAAWLAVWARSAGRKPWADQRSMVESAAVYWHMVDLLWIVIFTLLYLVCLP